MYFQLDTKFNIWKWREVGEQEKHLEAPFMVHYSEFHKHWEPWPNY